jgi:acyl-CoA thioester hydrolase
MTDLERDYPVVLYQDVIWGDMDAFGHVNNTTYFRYFEDARIAYFDKIEIGKVKSETGLGPILATTHCNFKLPLEYPDKIRIAGRARLMGPKKFNMEYLVYSERFDAVAAEGEGLLVFYDYHNGRSCDIPETVVSLIRSMEN